MEYTLSECLEYVRKNKSMAWIKKFLSHSNNSKLYLIMKNKGRMIDPQEFKLKNCIRIAGPEKGMIFSESKELFDKKVKSMSKGIKEGWDAPPLILWYKKNNITIADGSHRFEALKNNSVKKYPCFIWFEEKKDFENYNNKI